MYLIPERQSCRYENLWTNLRIGRYYRMEGWVVSTIATQPRKCVHYEWWFRFHPCFYGKVLHFLLSNALCLSLSCW
jgi:hypothetical protein